MAYTKQYSKTTWVNNQAPAINATNLNKIEEGIDNVDSGLVEVEQSLTARIDGLEADVAALESATDVPEGYVPTADGQDGWQWAAQSGSGGGLTDEIKTALLNCFNHVAWDDNDPTGQSYIDALEDALYPPATLMSISAVYTQSGTVYDTDSLDVLEDDLVVTAHYDDSTTQTIAAADYTLSGTLTIGTSAVTVTYSGKTATFSVTVVEGELDTTAQIETEGYITHDVNATHDTVAIANGGITIAYPMNAVSTILAPVGVIANDGVVGNGRGTIRVYRNGAQVTYVDEYNRWIKTPAATYEAFIWKSWNIAEYDSITFSLDTRYLDDSYMYDGITGQVWFAGRNTPFYGMRNVSEAYGSLPSGYTELSYVKATGNQHIDTDYIPTTATRYYIDAQTRTAGTDAPGGQDEGATQRTMFEAINGTTWSGNNILLAPYRANNSPRGYWGWYNASSTKQMYSGGTVDEERHNLVLFSENYVLENTLNWNGTANERSATYTYPVSLFGFLRDGVYSHMNDDMTLYGFRMYEGLNAVIPTVNLVPCKDPNNVVGLYDTIRREFYHSTTGTELIGGEVV